jgi:hypothetical protein
LNPETISDKLITFYQDYNLGEDGGNHLTYVTLEIGPFFKIYIPNWDNRRKAVLRHDIHHLLTGYKSELLGEFEIAAWEIGSGCMNYFAAYLLNSGGLLAGLLIYPIPTFKAFLLGCRTINLYQLHIEEKTLKNSTIDELKKRIGLDPKPNVNNPRLSEILKLLFHIILGFILQFFIFILSPLLIIYNIWMYGKRLFGK